LNNNAKRRIAITGAAGNLGRRLRIHWWARADLELILLDCAPGADPAIISGDLSEWNASWVNRLVGVETIVHLAANVDPGADKAALTGSNIEGVRNLYRAAVLHGVSRVILASSVWAMAGRARDTLSIFADDAEPGDNAYGSSKQFSEQLAREQALAGGPITIALRIGGCPPGANLPVRKNDWEDQCWLSNRDFCRGINCALDAPAPNQGFAVANLTSLIPDGRWDLEHTRVIIGYVPQDRYEPPAPLLVSGLRRAMHKVRRSVRCGQQRPSDVRLVSDVRCKLGEAPLWDPVRQCLWFVDIVDGILYQYRLDGDVCAHSIGNEPAFVVHDEAGGLLLGMGSTIQRFADDVLHIVKTIDLPPGARINDGCADSDGALWFGSMDRRGAEPAGCLHRYDGIELSRHGRPSPIVNGPAFSPDGAIIYQADTCDGSIWRFGAQDGLPKDGGRPFIKIDSRHGAPDGLTVDTEGSLWVALWGGWAARRYGSDGRLLAIVRFPCANVTKIAFGGPDLTIAYATTAQAGPSSQACRTQPFAGGLFQFDGSVAGLLPYRCSL
jgi:D-xylonolactonase